MDFRLELDDFKVNTGFTGDHSMRCRSCLQTVDLFQNYCAHCGFELPFNFAYKAVREYKLTFEQMKRLS